MTAGIPELSAPFTALVKIADASPCASLCKRNAQRLKSRRGGERNGSPQEPGKGAAGAGFTVTRPQALLSTSKSNLIAIYLRNTGIIGGPVHEMAHAITCLLFGLRIRNLALFAPDAITGQLSYVEFSYSPFSLRNSIGLLIQGIAPVGRGRNRRSLPRHIIRAEPSQPGTGAVGCLDRHCGHRFCYRDCRPGYRLIL